MRALTESEKQFCKALLENEEKFLGQKPLGDVVKEFCGVECFKKEKLYEDIENSPFTVRVCTILDRKDEVVKEVNEAIALILLLEKNGMISYTPIGSNRTIGEDSLLMDCSSTPLRVNIGFCDYFGVNTWSLLNSFYYLTNSFKDFVGHGFKTIESRRHRQTMIVSCIAIVVAFMFSMISLCLSLQNKQIEIIDTQFDSKTELMKKLINQNDSIIHLINGFDEDTVKMR